MRESFISSLINLKKQNKDIYVLDGDCSHSTRTYKYKKLFNDTFLNAGIAEQNMIGVAAGLSMVGFIPVVCGFAAILVSRAAEQIIQSIAYSRTNVKICGHYAGVSASREGAPHHSIIDIAILRAIPGMRILSPADDSDVYVLLKSAIEKDGPTYIRLSRNPAAAIAGGSYMKDISCRLWGVKGSILFVATGEITINAIRASSILRENYGTDSLVLSVLELKPFPSKALLDIIKLHSIQLIVTIEEHSVIGGLGSSVAEVLASHPGPKMLACGIEDRFTETGSYEELVNTLGLSPRKIIKRICNHMKTSSII